MRKTLNMGRIAIESAVRMFLSELRYIILYYIILYYIIYYFATNIILNGHEYYIESHCSVDRQVVLERAAAKYNNIMYNKKAKYNNMINKNIKARREGRVRYHVNILNYILFILTYAMIIINVS